jgi:uncharacterized membrane protein YeaQ/YmgE (transglycosylase-associated protein family)
MGLFWVWFILIGILAGYITGRLTKGSGFGVIGDLVIGALVLLKLISYLRSKGTI